MGNIKQFNLSAAIALLILAALLVGCEIPSPTAQEPQPVDQIDSGDITPTTPVIADTATPEPEGDSDSDSDEDSVVELTADAQSPSNADADSDSEDEGDGEGVSEDGDESPTIVPDPTTVPDETAEPTPLPTVAEPTAVPTTAALDPTTTATTAPSPTPSATVPPATDGSTSEILHTVQPGENLYRIGLQYNISWTVLQIYNGLPNANSLQVGQVIRIPVIAPSTQPDESGITPTPSTAVVHNVVLGETLFLIGFRYGIPWNQIAEANGIMNPASLKAGQQIKIPVEVVRNANELQHIVLPGDSLFRISAQYGVPWSSIAARNNILSPYTIYPNEGLTIPALGQ